MSAADYNFSERLLHRVALGSRRLCRVAFEMEQRYSADQPAPNMQQPVFVCGLARSGSTVLLNLLYQAGCFRSLTYRDMPFVLATGLWKKVSSGDVRKMEKRERAHGDSLLVDFDSPEAFEEVFWRCFCGDDYIQADRLQPHTVTTDNLKRFRQFVRQVLRSGEQPAEARYLSKNNNNVLRLPAIRRAFRDAVILVPFRDPLLQSNSLLNQHRRFSAQQAGDRFSRDYMRWLGHHEFGVGHKPFSFADERPGDPDVGLDYWLSCWLDCYRHLLQNGGDDIIFVCHERACRDPAALFERIAPHLGLSIAPGVARSIYRPAAEQPGTCDVNSGLLQQSRDVYNAMLEHNQSAL